MTFHKGEFKQYTDILITSKILSASDELTPERILELFHEFLYKNYNEILRTKKSIKE